MKCLAGNVEMCLAAMSTAANNAVSGRQCRDVPSSTVDCSYSCLLTRTVATLAVVAEEKVSPLYVYDG